MGHDLSGLDKPTLACRIGGVEYNAPVVIAPEICLAANEFIMGRNVGETLTNYYNPEVSRYEFSPEMWWKFGQWLAVKIAQGYYDAGYHKQVYNRLLEPHQFMKLVITATELNNFWWLRLDGAADPSIFELARIMKEAFDKSVPNLLHPGEYHLPYVEFFRDDSGGAMYRISDDFSEHGTSYGFVDLETAIKVSSARTAAVSFRNTDYGVEKSSEVYSRLIGDERIHGSAMEHLASPMQPEHFNNGVNVPLLPNTWEPGVTHVDRNGKLWSAKFNGWIMHRKLIPGENKAG